MQLYTGTISPNGKRARICAEEVGIELDCVNIDFQKGENKSADYLVLNPMGKVPTLRDGDLVLWESAAILCYLAQKGEGGFWPEGPQEQADLLRWLFFCSCHIDPYFTTLVVERFLKARRGLPANEALAADATGWLARFVPVLEENLQNREYVLGGFGIADIALGCTLEMAPLLKYDLTSAPNIQRWLDLLKMRKSWQNATPTPA